MPLSQAISDTDCIMREYNQLTAAGSYGERMILNRNQYKLNLTLSLAKRRRRAGDKEGSGGTRLGLGLGAEDTPQAAAPVQAASGTPGSSLGRRTASSFSSPPYSPSFFLSFFFFPPSPDCLLHLSSLPGHQGCFIPRKKGWWC